MPQDFKIVALNELNEPFNSSDLFSTPKYVNQNEFVRFFYASTSGLAFKGNEKWVWDFDFGTPLNLKDNIIQEFIGFINPLPVLFYRNGDRLVNVKIYDRIPKKSVKIQTKGEINTGSKPVDSIFNPLTNNLLILNENSNNLTIINTLTNLIVKTLNLSGSPKSITYSDLHNKFYISLSNSTVDVIDANLEIVLSNIPLSLSGVIDYNNILYVSSVDLVYVTINSTPNSKIEIIDPNLDSTAGLITILPNAKELKYFNDYLWTVNTVNNFLSKINVISNIVSTISTSNNPQNLIVDENRSLIYIRCFQNLNVCNLNVITDVISVGNVVDSSDLAVNNTLEEIYLISGTNSTIQAIDSNDYSILPKFINVKGIKSLFYDDISNSIYCNEISNTIKKFKLIDASDFIEHGFILDSGDIYKIYKIPSGKVYGLEKNSNKVSFFNYFTSNTNEFIDGKLLYQDTNHFYVFQFPNIITGLEYAIEGQNLNYSTNSGSNSAQKYEWFVNEIKQLSVINSFNLTFTNLVKAIIKVNIINGRITKTLTFTTSLSVVSSVIGKKYEGNVKDSLMFFNKEGDNLNFELVQDDLGDTHWEGDLLFHPNSDDTFKTIGLYLLERVEPIEFSSEKLLTRKLQLFNEEGLDIEKGFNNGETILIDRIEVVNKQTGFYSKWLYSTGIENKISIGSELFITDFYNVIINNSLPDNPILTSYSIINEFNSYSTSGGVDLFTVIDSKKDAIMILTKTENTIFTTTYNYGDFRLQNNSIKNIPQGKVQLYNIFKIYDPQNLNIEWNEPFYKTLLYDKKKISLINSQKNDGVYTINFLNDDISNDFNQKYLKSRCINIKDLLPLPKFDFRIKLKFKTNKIFLGSNPVNFLPASTNPFLNGKSILVWEAVLNKDFTPILLKDGLKFSFEQISPTEDNFDKIYNTIKIDVAQNILTPQTSDLQGWKISLNNNDLLSGFTFNFIINNISIYSAKEGIDWKKGNSINDAAKSLASFLDSTSNKVIGLSVIAINNEIWIWEKSGYKFILLNIIDNTIFNLNKGILKENSPKYGIVGDVWVYLNDPIYNGYVHYRTITGNFFLLYITGTGLNQLTNWYVLPVNKKIVWTSQSDKLNSNTGFTIDFKENLISNAHLEETILYFTQTGDNNSTSEQIVERFIQDNKNTLLVYGLDIVRDKETFCLNNNFSTKTINIQDDYIDVSFQVQYEAQFGTSGTAGTPKFINSTSSYISFQLIDMFNVIEDVINEKNHISGKYLKTSSLSHIYERKIIIKDIDQKAGFNLNINGIDYHVDYDNISVSGLNPQQDLIVDIEQTLKNWGNQKFKLSQEITTTVDDSDIGKFYYEVLELQGVLVWLEKSEEAIFNNVKHFDTIVIQSKYPNVGITYSVNGTLNNHKVLHSDIEFLDIGRELTLTINRVVYTILNNGGILNTINSWVNEWKDTLLELGIIVNSLDFIYDTSGLTPIIISYPKLRLGTFQEKTQLNYQVWVGKTPIIGKPLYNIINYRKGNNGIILSGNEVRINVANFEDIGFATAMIMSLKGSKFPLNNHEYNIIFVDPNVLGLSYQGAFWNNTDKTGYIIDRSNFNWQEWNNILIIPEITGVYNTSGVYNITDLTNATYLEYDAFNDHMWVSHNSGLNGNITIYDVKDYSTKGLVQVSNNPVYMKWNPLNKKIYVANKGSNRITQIDTDTFNIDQNIPVGISPSQLVIDNYNNNLYVLNEDSDDISVINLNDNSIITIPVGDKPIRFTLDRKNRFLYVACQNNNRVYVINTIDNSLKTYINIGNRPVDIIWNDKWDKVIVSNSLSNTLSIIKYNIINDSFSIKTVNTYLNPNSLQYNNDKDILWVSCNNKIQFLNLQLDIIDNIIDITSNVGILKFVPFSRTLFYTLPTINSVGLFNIDDIFSNQTIIPLVNNPNYINWSINERVFITNYNSNLLSVLKQIPINNSSSGTSGLSILSLSTREFLRYPRERFNGEDPIFFKTSWEDVNESMFFYDFSGKQLTIEMKNSNSNLAKINDQGIFNYKGTTPLIIDNNAFLNKLPNKDKTQTSNPKVQQTIFDVLYHDLELVDSEVDIDPRPFPLQLFIGYQSKQEGVDNRTLIIERLENINLIITTKLKDELNPNLGYIDILDFNSDLNEIKLRNSNINFIELGFQKGQIIEFSGKDILNTKNQSTFKNAGLTAKIDKVFVNRMILIPINKNMNTESSFRQTTSILPPFRTKDSALQIKIEIKPTLIAKIHLHGQTEIEDDRFNVMLNNIGYNINHRDIFIFKEYDINEAGIDWIYLNEKRKEMLINSSEIWNFLSSYKALINSVNFFGYQDLQVNEYYLNVDTTSPQFNKLHKVEIPDIFDMSAKGFNPNDFILASLPNKRYNKTKLFNLTYQITDLDGNFVLGYSLDEVIIKLLGLKNYLRENIMPIGTRIKDITGNGSTPASTTIWNDVKFSRKFHIEESLTPVDFKIEAYLQPVENNSKTYNVHLEFFTQGTNFLPEYYQVNIYTFSAIPNYTDPNFKLRTVQNYSYYKTDYKAINFTADRYTDGFIMVEVISDTGSLNYKVVRTYQLNLII